MPDVIRAIRSQMLTVWSASGRWRSYVDNAYR